MFIWLDFNEDADTEVRVIEHDGRWAVELREGRGVVKEVTSEWHSDVEELWTKIGLAEASDHWDREDGEGRCFMPNLFNGNMISVSEAIQDRMEKAAIEATFAELERVEKEQAALARAMAAHPAGKGLV